MTIYLILLLFAGPVVFHVVTRYNRRGRILRKIPGPFAYPFVGNLLKFNVNCLHEFWKVGREITKKYYPITRFWLCRTAVISVLHPDDLEILFTSPKFIDKGYIYEYLHPWLKTGLLTSTGSKWRHRRKILTPAFHFSILKKYMEITNEEGKKFMDELKKENEDKEIVKSLVPFCSKCTLNIICESAMGVGLDTIDGKIVDEYKKAVHDMGNVVLYRMPRPYITTWMMNFVWKMGRVQRNAVKILHGFTDKVIRDRKDYHKRTENTYLKEFLENVEKDTWDEIDVRKKKRLAMLDLLLAAEYKGLIDYNGVKEEVDTFTFEAHDTTGMAMTFALLLLAENKEAQDLARAEVTEVLDKNDGQIKMSDLQDLHYLERCIKETLRLFPPVATLVRYTREELQLKHALIPADSHIMIHLYDTHRDPNFWADPEKFDPDRFLFERSKDRHPFAYVPFSAGPRNCIGQKFAVMELKSLIGRILYDFYLEPIDRTSDIKLMADIVLRPLDPVRIKLIKINKSSN
ncbi:cytochrome P450 4C1-like [Copidosoma floridanum]|uniref:cytochrome P450 4C1-like n=1 Tax=Copidosoma floridanum TaxID=29053 RepID=UPI0006C9815E|nr:cytochrome P450 4C1-like [Copidosoma floridanum]